MVVGVVLISVAVWAHQRESHFVEVQGKVVDSVRERDGDSWAPVVEFEVNGQLIKQTGSFSSTRTANGEAMSVQYDPADPANSARVMGPLGALAFPAAFLLGLFALISGVVGFLRQSAQQRKPVE